MDKEFEASFIKQCNSAMKNALLTFKGHFNVSARWRSIHLLTGVLIAICSFIAGASIISEIKGVGIFITGSMGIIGGILAAIVTFLDPNSIADKHREAAANYKSIRDRLDTLSSVKLSNKYDANKLTRELESLKKEYTKLDAVYHVLPQWAYKKARKRINNKKSPA